MIIFQQYEKFSFHHDICPAIIAAPMLTPDVINEGNANVYMKSPDIVRKLDKKVEKSSFKPALKEMVLPEYFFARAVNLNSFRSLAKIP